MSKIQIAYQVFHSVRPVIPLWGAELVSTFHDHPQHQHLFAVPERWRASQQGEKDHSTGPAVQHKHQNKSDIIVGRQGGFFHFNNKS